jgi:NAD-dependent deacetylase
MPTRHILPQCRKTYVELFSCDLLLCVGTSGLVEPAASLPFLAKERGATLAVINPNATPQASAADYFLAGRAGDILPALLETTWPEQ